MDLNKFKKALGINADMPEQDRYLSENERDSIIKNSIAVYNAKSIPTGINNIGTIAEIAYYASAITKLTRQLRGRTKPTANSSDHQTAKVPRYCGSLNVITVMEECAELIESLSASFTNTDIESTKLSILEETADVALGVRYIQKIFNISDDMLTSACDIKLKACDEKINRKD